jgi:tetratricopeptide (TPR) repeat protein
MLVWRIFILICVVVSTGAVTRPDAKTTVRALARLPRIELRFSLDFDGERGFVLLRSSKDPALAIGEMQLKLNGSAEDAHTWLELGGLRLDAGDLPAARREFQRSTDSARKRLDVEPGNGRLRLDLAQALHGLGRQAEAESILREAVKAAPNSITNRLALAQFLDVRAWELVTDATNWRGRRGYGELARMAVRRGASTETADRAERLLNEAIATAREAARLDETSARAQFRLGVTLASKDCFEAVRQRIAGRELSRPVESMIFSRAAIEPFEKSAALDPQNPIRLATALFWRGMAEAAERRALVASGTERPVWEVFSDANRRAIEAGLERLNQFDDSSSAADALQALGTLRFVFQNDLRGASDALQRAAAINPDSEQTWETLLQVLQRKKDYFEFAAVCEARALVRPTVRNRVVLAKAHEKLGNDVRALEEIVNAVALDANDFWANVGLANLLMKLGDEEMSSRARQSLVTAERAIRSGGTGPQYVDLALAQAIYQILAGDEERAREILKAARAYTKENAEVNTALNAIGY